MAKMRLVTLDQVDPKAVCTDGSSAGYYWEPSTGDAGSHLWIMYLQGGDWCYSRESCEKRCGVAPGAGALCSSRKWARSYRHFGYPCGGRSPKKLCGLFSPSEGDDGALRSANKVFVRYCTSDAHMGNATAFGFHFRGARVVRAVLTDLVGRGLGQRVRMDTLLFGGGSAGARGAMIHLDYVQGMLGSVAPKVEVVGLLDSPLWMEMPEFRKTGASETTLPEQTQFVYRFANVGNLDSGCMAKYGLADGWKCIFAEYRMPFVKTKYLLVAAQGDKFQLDNLLQHRPSAPDEFTYAERFAAETRKVLHALSSEKHAILSWSCYNHMCSLSDDFDKASATTSAGNVSIAGALEQFLLASLPGASSDDGPSGKPLIWMDDCVGFACGRGCPPGAGRLPSDVLPKQPEPPAEPPRRPRKTHPFLAAVLLLLCCAGIAAACWNHRLLTKLGGSFAGVARLRHLEESYAALSGINSPPPPAPRSPAPMWAHTPLSKKPGAFPSLGHMVWTEEHFEAESCDSPTDMRENGSPISAPTAGANEGLQYLGLFCGCNNHRPAAAEAKRPGFVEAFTAVASLLSCSRPKPQALYSL